MCRCGEKEIDDPGLSIGHGIARGGIIGLLAPSSAALDRQRDSPAEVHRRRAACFSVAAARSDRPAEPRRWAATPRQPRRNFRRPRRGPERVHPHRLFASLGVARRLGRVGLRLLGMRLRFGRDAHHRREHRPHDHKVAHANNDPRTVQQRGDHATDAPRVGVAPTAAVHAPASISQVLSPHDPGNGAKDQAEPAHENAQDAQHQDQGATVRQRRIVGDIGTRCRFRKQSNLFLLRYAHGGITLFKSRTCLPTEV